MKNSTRVPNWLMAAAIALGGAIFAMATLAPAQAQRQGGLFDRLDQNGDGAVEQSELDARRAEAFDKLDANSDGNVSRDEFMASENRMMQRFDADGDGRITREEMVSARRARGGAGMHGGMPMFGE